MRPKKYKLKQWKFPQIVFFVFTIIIIFLYISFAYLSLSPKIFGINMDEFAKKRDTVKQILYAKRGNILDTEGNTLAQTVSSYTVIAYLDKRRSENFKDPKHVVDPKAAAKALAPVLNMDENYLLKLLTKKVYQVELGPGGRGISELKKEEVQALGLPGIDFIESNKRYYPNGNFASYIIGYAKENDKGNIVGELGVEAKYNNVLKGTDGKLVYQRDRKGYKIPGTKEERVDAENGSDIYLTLDSSIQRFLESAVKQSEKTYNPEWLVISAMDAKTGDILGVASSPSFDPNKRNISNYENPLTTYVYEPGSTMKTFTYMCAIDKGTYNPSATYTSGKYKVGEDVIQDWNGGLGWGNITYDKGYEYSSNVGIANLLKNYLSKKDLKECFSKYGFGKKTGIELSREMTGNTKFSYDVEYITSGFGQGITSTIVQQLQALTIISNNGKMLKPHIIKKMVDTNNNEVTYKRKIEQSEQLVKSETVSKIKELMYNVIHGKDPGSTGYPYRIDGFDIIGKTGTSQIYDEKTGAWLKGENNYIFSFSGMYPKDNPEIIIYAAMRRPTNGKSAGLYTAVTDVMKSIAKYKNMFGDSKKELTSGNYKLNSYINKDTDAVKSELSNNGINTIVIGNGKKIIKQYPASGTDILTSDKVFLITNDTQGKIPSMIGWSRSEAIKFLELVGISYETEGYGYVTEQSLNTNTLITTKDKMHLKFNNKYDIDKEQQTKDN